MENNDDIIGLILVSIYSLGFSILINQAPTLKAALALLFWGLAILIYLKK